MLMTFERRLSTSLWAMVSGDQSDNNLTDGSMAMVYRVIVFIFVLCISDVRTQWAVEDDGCRTPDRGVGTCISIMQCKPIVDLVTEAPKPLSKEIRDLLIAYQCGLDFKSVKVCCPDKAINRGGDGGTTPKTPSAVNPPDVSGHRNVGLLSDKSCGLLQTDDKILNGNLTALFEFPWMALISYRIGRGVDFRCGGTLINERYILTAAHCITNLGRLSLAGVRLGEHDLAHKDDCETHPEGDTVCADPVQDMAIEQVIPHPKYNTTNYSNDIGLLRLARRANISVENVKPICLPISPSIMNPELKKGVVTGWGRTENESKSNVLLKVEIPVMNQEQCRREYEKTATITHLQLCAGGVNNQDSCAGDSGGPMQVLGNVNSDARYIQYGVVSFGPVPCGTIGRPGVYTRVAHYLDWILDNIKP